MKILSGPQIIRSGDTLDIFVVGQVVDKSPSSYTAPGNIHPVLVSRGGTKDVPSIGDVVKVEPPSHFLEYFYHERK